jgi:hypothetical protein
VRIALTLLVRDEADIVGDHVAFHLSRGVDVVVATVHRSRDGTAEILQSYARNGRVRLMYEDGEEIRQSEWMTRMARLAATEYGADWVLNSDADEFWWPRGGSLGELLGAVPPRYGAVHAFSHSFVPRPGHGAFSERMTARLASVAALNDPETSFRPVAKVLHRGDPRAVVGQGNHDVWGIRQPVLSGVFPIELLHFPLRSTEQIARKHENTLAAWERNLRGDLARARLESARGRANAFYERVVVDDPALERGLAAGTLVLDTRLRDALRALRRDDRPRGTRAPDEPGASAAELAAHAAAITTLADANAVRLQRRVDELSARLVTSGGRSARFEG